MSTPKTYAVLLVSLLALLVSAGMTFAVLNYDSKIMQDSGHTSVEDGKDNARN